MPPVILPPAVPEYVIDLSWPRIDTAIDSRTPGGFETNGVSRYGAATVSIFGAEVGVGTNTSIQYNGELGGDFQAGSGRLATGVRMYPNFLASNYSAGFRRSEIYRVCRVQFLYAVRTNLGTDGGFAFIGGPDNASTPTYPGAVGAGIGFGVQGDGAGGLQYFTKQTVAGGFTDVTPLATWPLQTNVAVVDMELQSATAQANAQFRLWVNGVLMITRGGAALPGYPVNFNHYVWGTQVGGAGRSFLGNVHITCGRFTADNLELLNAVNGGI